MKTILLIFLSSVVISSCSKKDTATIDYLNYKGNYRGATTYYENGAIKYKLADDRVTLGFFPGVNSAVVTCNLNSAGFEMAGNTLSLKKTVVLTYNGQDTIEYGTINLNLDGTITIDLHSDQVTYPGGVLVKSNYYTGTLTKF